MNEWMRVLAVTLFTIPIFPIALSGQWAVLSDEEQLREKIILDVGTLYERSEFVTRYDPLLEMNRTEEINWKEFQGRQRYCMPDPLSLGLGVGRDAALLLTDSKENLWVAILESSVGSIKVEVEPVALMECPF